MKAFPMFIKTTDRRVIIVGGGEQAAQKARLILKTDARIVLASVELDAELKNLVDTGRAEHYVGALTEDLFAGAAMAFVATGCFAVDLSAHSIAKAARCPVNVVDQPDLCDITTPAIVDRDPVVVAIGTEGTAPVLARQIKTMAEENLPQSLGGLAALAGRLRPAVAQNIASHQRRGFWRWVFAERPMQFWKSGQEAKAVKAIKAAIAAAGDIGVREDGAVSVVGAGPGARDLLTLRAVQRLQEADIIYFEGDGDHPALELARRDAERCRLNAPSHAVTGWPKDAMLQRMVFDAKRNRRVVFLSNACPTESRPARKIAQLCNASEIDCELVPGVRSRVAEQTCTPGIRVPLHETA